VIDGLAFLADGSLYVNDFATGRLFRIPVNPDGSAGPIVPIETSMPLVRPDGLRSAGPRTLLQAEQQGRVAELTISGDRAEVRRMFSSGDEKRGDDLVLRGVGGDWAAGDAVPVRRRCDGHLHGHAIRCSRREAESRDLTAGRAAEHQHDRNQ